MKRLLATLVCDVRIQLRNGFYAVTAAVLIFWVVLYALLPHADLSVILPAFLVDNLLVTTFYFVGGLVLLEKGEGTLEFQVVTPLRVNEYLLSKVLTLAALSLLENGVLAVILGGWNMQFVWLALGISLASAFYVLIGFVVVSRYDAINEYLLPSMPWVLFFSLTLIGYFGVWDSPLMYLHPLYPPLVLISGAFRPLAVWEIFYGLLASLAWIGLAWFFSRRAFQRFVLMKQGVH